ncbi:MAG: hypothetical protein CVU39_09420 [Chloroflexi bacterium HGW-Chloroflexi-10]|nr:MAG: hypothetical protein CVU39_09420 [Chloroflexi bacterium HGW-Chloroflexi-10]
MFFDLFISNFANRENKKRWAEKSPNNVFCIEDMLSFFPNQNLSIIGKWKNLQLNYKSTRLFDFMFKDKLIKLGYEQ